MRFSYMPALLVLCALCLSELSAYAAARHDAWVGTWASAPLAGSNERNIFAEDTTLRQYVHVSLGGRMIRIVLTNEFGDSDLKIGGASVALPATATGDGYAQDGSLKPRSTMPVLFGGHPGIIIAPGALAVS